MTAPIWAMTGSGSCAAHQNLRCEPSTQRNSQSNMMAVFIVDSAETKSELRLADATSSCSLVTISGRGIFCKLHRIESGAPMIAIGRLLGSGKEAQVFEYRALALKLYRHPALKASAFREGANLAIVEGCRCRRRRFMRSARSKGAGAR
ncbi:hypothetical protein [Rhizobium sp. CNPSo 3490]|uniref:hypothetical protein n=1 Tax=Rhizobium sp. CNPSo 3490 TaxID=3021407 RepID=UPI00254F0FA9|nr:hypothetical protein [Rhizobium sp. CNPSo 3490]MDK4731403.1 hypothetical protein [Rhizobium sp. CNPSo 3490]